MESETLQMLGYVAQGLTALSAIVAAATSMVNKGKIQEVTLKVERAVIIARETKQENIQQTQEVKQAVAEVKEIIKNGKNGSH